MIDLGLSAYEYDLPKELIAQKPLDKRDGSRLLVLERASGRISHKIFSDITQYLLPGDCLVINRTKVVPARLFGKKETGGKVEALFLDPANIKRGGAAAALLKPFVESGKTIYFPGGLTAKVESKTKDGETVLKLDGAEPLEVLNASGIMPLPPYIKRRADSNELTGYDKERYQTVFAEENGSIAAPTAGLHFTPELIKKISNAGVESAKIVLHVGWGTFKPVTAYDISKHVMLPERYEIDEDAARKLDSARGKGKRIIAVGTTTVRTLESAAGAGNFDVEGFIPQKNETSIFIYPGHVFKAVDCMVTNFHLPHSTPFAMVCAFAGRENIFKAYAEAVKEKYRFYSYGDAMLII
jgi:S-adenosylmethionine:tRNA ribosyltransferase-isomerase